MREGVSFDFKLTIYWEHFLFTLSNKSLTKMIAIFLKSKFIRLTKLIVRLVQYMLFKSKRIKDIPKKAEEPEIKETPREVFPKIKRSKPIPIIRPKNYSEEERMLYTLRMEESTTRLEMYLLAHKYGMEANRKSKYITNILLF